MKKADLHCHSTNSDGGHSLDYLLEIYRDKGYDVVAITDHYAIGHGLRDDSVLQMKKDLYGIDIIIGMEAVGEINNEWVHLLCYFNKNSDLSEKILTYLDGQAEFVYNFNERVKSIMKERGVLIPDINYSLLDPTGYMPILMEVVKRTGKTIKETRKEFFTFMGGLDVPKHTKLTVSELIEEVHKSKGLIVMAHPLQFKKETMMKAISMGIDGIEAIYPTYSEEERNVLIEIAKDNNILWTAGSDFHYTVIDAKKHGEIGSVQLDGDALEITSSKNLKHQNYNK